MRLGPVPPELATMDLTGTVWQALAQTPTPDYLQRFGLKRWAKVNVGSHEVMIRKKMIWFDLNAPDWRLRLDGQDDKLRPVAFAGDRQLASNDLVALKLMLV